MPTKIFTTIGGPCPFGMKPAIDSSGCRSCQHFYRTGTSMFFWCNHPIEQKQSENGRKAPKKAQKTKEIAQKTKKTGRPRKQSKS